MTHGVKRILLANELVGPGRHPLAPGRPWTAILPSTSPAWWIPCAGVRRLEQAAQGRRPIPVLVELGVPGGRTGRAHAGGRAGRGPGGQGLASPDPAGRGVLRGDPHHPGPSRGRDGHHRLAGPAGGAGPALRRTRISSRRRRCCSRPGVRPTSTWWCAAWRRLELGRARPGAPAERVLPLPRRRPLRPARARCWKRRLPERLAHPGGPAARPGALGPGAQPTGARSGHPQFRQAGCRPRPGPAGAPALVPPGGSHDGGARRLAPAHPLRPARQAGTARQGAELAPGDLVGCSISHPCTTFDKWPVVFLLDDEDRVVDALRTFF